MDELKIQIEMLKSRVEKLEAENNLLKNSATIPFDVDAAFRDRLAFKFTSSSKSASSENQAVNEAGSSSYNVLKPPDGFDQITTGTTTKYYPFFT